MNDHPTFEKLRQAVLTPEQHVRLFERIAATFKCAINARSPQHRPPGKAGLRAEKGYYRLLYLEGILHEMVTTGAKAGLGAPPHDWDPLIDIMRQLTDIPELRTEIMAGVESALDEMVGPMLIID